MSKTGFLFQKPNPGIYSFFPNYRKHIYTEKYPYLSLKKVLKTRLTQNRYTTPWVLPSNSLLSFTAKHSTSCNDIPCSMVSMNFDHHKHPKTFLCNTLRHSYHFSPFNRLFNWLLYVFIIYNNRTKLMLSKRLTTNILISKQLSTNNLVH